MTTDASNNGYKDASNRDRAVENIIREIDHPGVTADYYQSQLPTQAAEPLEDRVERDRSHSIPDQNSVSCTGYGWRWIWN